MRKYAPFLLVVILLFSCSLFENSPTSSLDIPSDLNYEFFNLNHVDIDELNWTRGYIYNLDILTYTDENGIQMRMYDNQLYYHPVASAGDFLRCIETYIENGDQSMLDYVEMGLHFWVDRAHVIDDALYFQYEFDFMYHHTDPMEPPWFSAMSQGMFLASFARMYHLTDDPWFYQQGRRVLKSFTQFDREIPAVFVQDNYYWLDEYPLPPGEEKIRVLNGMIHALCGLYDWWWATGEYDCRRLLEYVLTTIKHHIEEYRIPHEVSAYCLKYRVQDPNYHHMHTEQLTYLGLISGDSYFTNMAILFYHDYH